MNRKSTSQQSIGVVCVLAAAILWGSMGVFVRYLNARGLMALDVTQVRITVGFIAIAIYLLLFRRDLLRVRLKDLWCFVGTGICGTLMLCVCYFKAMEVGVSLSTAAILLYTAPVFVTVMSLILFHEKLTLLKITALVTALLGCVLVSGTGGENQGGMAGILLGIGSGLFYALLSIFSRYAIRRGYTSLTTVFYAFLFCFVACSFFCDWNTITAVVIREGDVKIWLLALGLGIVTGFLPYVLYSQGLTYMESSKASIIASVEPVVGTLFGVFLFRESLTVSGGVGVALVLSAVVLLSIPPRKHGED